MGPIASMLFIFESIIFLPDAVYFAMMKAIHPIIRGDTMTLQQLKYVIAVAEKGSITEAAKDLYISQPSLSGAIKEVEKEATLTIFNRCRAGVALTTEGMEFLGYARQVVQQMELLESRYIDNRPEKIRFCVSTQHYTFAANAFVELVQHFAQERYEFILNETQTHQIIEDVRNRFSDLGVLYLSQSNESVLRKSFEEFGLDFHELFTAAPHVFLRREHPLASYEKITLKDLQPYPRLSFVQGGPMNPLTLRKNCLATKLQTRVLRSVTAPLSSISWSGWTATLFQVAYSQSICMAILLFRFPLLKMKRCELGIF